MQLKGLLQEGFLLLFLIFLMEEQIKKIDRATDKALHEIEKERKGKQRDYIAEWFKWVEKVGKYLRKHILH